MIIKCPHCDSEILIEEKDINCGIFVHAVMKKSGKQVNPHSSQTLLNKLILLKKFEYSFYLLIILIIFAVSIIYPS